LAGVIRLNFCISKAFWHISMWNRVATHMLAEMCYKQYFLLLFVCVHFVCAADKPVENTVDLLKEHDGVEMKREGSKRLASKNNQEKGKKAFDVLRSKCF
jgi:hypothetical protein